DAAFAALENAVRTGDYLAISAITWTEILTDAALGHREEAMVRGFVADFAVKILVVDAGIAERAARIRARQVERTGGDRPGWTGARRDALIHATADAHPDVQCVVGGDARWTRICRPLDVAFVRLRG